MTQTSDLTSTFVSLMLARRGLAPTPAFHAQHAAGKMPAKDFILPASTRILSGSEIAVRVVAIAALLLAAGANMDRDPPSSAPSAVAVHA